MWNLTPNLEIGHGWSYRRGEARSNINSYIYIFLCLGVGWWLKLSIAHGEMVQALDRTLD